MGLDAICGKDKVFAPSGKKCVLVFKKVEIMLFGQL
jgi:hypothetical protein